jgi:hypothetical protein
MRVLSESPLYRFEEALFTDETAAIEWLHQPRAALGHGAGPPP